MVGNCFLAQNGGPSGLGSVAQGDGCPCLMDDMCICE